MKNEIVEEVTTEREHSLSSTLFTGAPLTHQFNSIRALTIRQPWADAIFAPPAGWKDIENRSRSLKYRGWLAIHAATSLDHQFSPRMDINRWMPLVPVTGAIIGVAYLTDIVTYHPSPWFIGPYGYVLLSPFRLSNPIRTKGKLGLWNLSENENLILNNRLSSDSWSAHSADTKNGAIAGRLTSMSTIAGLRSAHQSIRFDKFSPPLISSALRLLRPLEKLYPSFEEWYTCKVKEIESGLANASVATTTSGELIAILIESIKANARTKISTLYVAESFRRRGIGTYLLTSHLVQSYLSNRLEAYITFDQSVLSYMRPFLSIFGFKQCAIHNKRYRSDSQEIVYRIYMK